MRRSLINLRRSDVRSKPVIKGYKKNNHIYKKRQRTLTEFKIPTATSLEVRKRNGMTVVVNDSDTAFVVDEEEEEEEDGGINLKSNESDLIEVYEETRVNESFDDEITAIEPVANKVAKQQQPTIEIIASQDEVMNISSESIVVEEEINSSTVTKIEEKEEEGDSIVCPICHMDMSSLELFEREAHCETCLEKRFTTEPSKKKKSLVVKTKESTKKSLSTATKKAKKVKPKPKLPIIKILTFQSGYKLVVDGFNYASDPTITKYFLSHFHSDHYIGLKKSWDNGTVYCSSVTSKLLQYKFKFPSDRIVELVNDQWVEIIDGIDVMIMDANHCPGASIFLFRERDGKMILHTGDFRVSSSLMDRIESKLPVRKFIDEIYLDTTYLNVGHCHPSQSRVIDITGRYIGDYFAQLNSSGTGGNGGGRNGNNNNILDKLMKRRNVKKRNVVLVGSYSIGKEKLALGISKFLNGEENGSIFIDINKDQLRSLFIQSEQILNLNDDGSQNVVDVHIVPLGIIKDDLKICEYIRRAYDNLTWLDVNLICLIPTGWTFQGHWAQRTLPPPTWEQKMQIVQGMVNEDEDEGFNEGWFKDQLSRRERSSHNKKLKDIGKFPRFNVPYSEHSSFNELIRFLSWDKIQWGQVIPTVNLDQLNDMREWFNVITHVKESRRKREV